MNVLLADTGRTWRGGQRQVLLLAHGLARRRVDVHLWAPRHSPLAAAAAREGIPTSGPRRVRSDLAVAGFGLLRAARRCDAAVVHAHDARAHAAGRVAQLLGLRPPLVVTRRVTRRPRGRWKYGRGVTRYIAISEAVRRALEIAGIAGERIDQVPSAVLAPAPTERAARPVGDGALVVAVTALAREKGVATVVDAAAHRLRSRPHARWIVAGDGPLLGRLRRRAVRARAPVTFTGFLDDPGPLLRAADVLVHAPSAEGLGTVVLDALARGIAVVATDVGGLAELVTPDVGVLVPAGSARAVARAVDAVLGDDDLRASARRRGPAVAARFTPGRMVRGTLASYETALAAAAGGPRNEQT